MRSMGKEVMFNNMESRIKSTNNTKFNKKKDANVQKHGSNLLTQPSSAEAIGLQETLAGRIDIYKDIDINKDKYI